MTAATKGPDGKRREFRVCAGSIQMRHEDGEWAAIGDVAIVNFTSAELLAIAKVVRQGEVRS